MCGKPQPESRWWQVSQPLCGKEWHACHKLNTVPGRCITRCRLPQPQTFPNFPVFLRIQHAIALTGLWWIRRKALVPPSGWKREFLLILVTCPADSPLPSNSCSRLQFPLASSTSHIRDSIQMLGFCGPTARRINPRKPEGFDCDGGCFSGCD